MTSKKRTVLDSFSTGKKTSKRRVTRQTKVIPGQEDRQAVNNAGGVSYKVADLERVKRFLILGTESPTYYQSERELTAQNAKTLISAIEADGDVGTQVIDLVLDLWNNDRAPRPNPIMFALALCASKGGEATRAKLEQEFNKTVRTGYHLFRFVHYVNEFRGWGRYLKRVVANWYLDKPVEDAAFQCAKYQSRDGWSHRDVLRLCHARGDKGHDSLFKIVTGKAKPRQLIEPFKTMAKLNKMDLNSPKTDILEKAIIKAIKEKNITHEMIPTQFKNSAAVWQAFLEKKMPLTAMIRNLGVMTNKGTLGVDTWDNNEIVIKALGNSDLLKKAHIHPVQALSAWRVYGQGHSFRGNSSWSPVPEIRDALEKAFVESFQYVEPANKRFLVGLDVSGSMGMGEVAGVPGLNPREVGACLLLTLLKSERKCIPMAFSHDFALLPFSSRSTIDSIVDHVHNMNFGSTDCALPMVYALKNKIEVDAFVVITDNETWAGKIHPTQALDQYRKQINPNAKLIVIATTASDFSIADPTRDDMLDIVGFDAATPRIITEFVS